MIFKDYLSKYPQGQFAGVAGRRLKLLEGEAAKVATKPSEPKPSPAVGNPPDGPRVIAADGYVVQQSAEVGFKVGSIVLSDEAKQILDRIANQALGTRGYRLSIRVSVSEGTSLENQRLTQRRIDTVTRYLMESHSIPADRISVEKKSPEADPSTREGRAQNRIIEIRVLAKPSP